MRNYAGLTVSPPELEPNDKLKIVGKIYSTNSKYARTFPADVSPEMLEEIAYKYGVQSC